ncbi:hypothetical protein VTK73DRAFT_7714 [Phialemonium thermophilum]|uniref:Uncharacterized protein n=1 Tax=Phialemonium thermophilum TaxID=223376 RepID=A0ABR3WD36_9PEZI
MGFQKRVYLVAAAAAALVVLGSAAAVCVHEVDPAQPAIRGGRLGFRLGEKNSAASSVLDTSKEPTVLSVAARAETSTGPPAESTPPPAQTSSSPPAETTPPPPAQTTPPPPSPATPDPATVTVTETPTHMPWPPNTKYPDWWYDWYDLYKEGPWPPFPDLDPFNDDWPPFPLPPRPVYPPPIPLRLQDLLADAGWPLDENGYPRPTATPA